MLQHKYTRGRLVNTDVHVVGTGPFMKGKTQITGQVVDARNVTSSEICGHTIT